MEFYTAKYTYRLDFSGKLVKRLVYFFHPDKNFIMQKKKKTSDYDV